jgi:hypothetical protein
VHQPSLDKKLLDAAMERFFRLRRVDGIRKKPSTSEFLDWLRVLARAGAKPEDVAAHFMFIGVLLKQEQDLDTVDKHKRPMG